MEELNSRSVEELEALCDNDALEFLRTLHANEPASYRAAIIEYLARPQVPIPEILSAIRDHRAPGDAWQEIVAACRRSAARAPWDRLPAPVIERDITAAHDWLAGELPRHRSASGVYLGLNTLMMRGGREANIEIGCSIACDPASDSQNWLRGPLSRGNGHLIRGLYDLHSVYSGAAWSAADEGVAPGTHLEFADYTLSLGYSGIVLGHAFRRLPAERLRLVVWGFHDGDLFLLGRTRPGGFDFVCK
jgi:hypothetical protein